MSEARGPNRRPPATPTRVRLRKVRVIWLPLLLVTLNAILVVAATLVALLLIPVVLVALSLAALLRATVVFISRGHLLARRRRPEDAAEVEPAGRALLDE